MKKSTKKNKNKKAWQSIMKKRKQKTPDGYKTRAQKDFYRNLINLLMKGKM